MSHAPIPQTVEDLQRIMERDAILLENRDNELRHVKAQNRALRIKLLHLRSKQCKLKAV